MNYFPNDCHGIMLGEEKQPLYDEEDLSDRLEVKETEKKAGISRFFL
ncbi:hypothetical protein [Lunatibacter salilacus]|nr:hypothetical protein [Lunatibacter salilacus]